MRLEELPEAYDDGVPLPASWGHCKLEEDVDTPEYETIARITQIAEQGTGLREKLDRMPAALRQAISQSQERLEQRDHDKRYKYELVQVDSNFQPVPASSKAGSSSSKESQQSEKSKTKDRERDSRRASEKSATKGGKRKDGAKDSKDKGRGKDKSKGKEKDKRSKDEKKGKGKDEKKDKGDGKNKDEDKTYAKLIGEPDAVTLYFRRFPGPYENAIFMLEQLNESKTRMPGVVPSSQQRAQAPQFQQPMQLPQRPVQIPHEQPHAQHRQPDLQNPASYPAWTRPPMEGVQPPSRHQQQGSTQKQYGQPDPMQHGQQPWRQQHQQQPPPPPEHAQGPQQSQGQQPGRAYQMPDAPGVPPPPPAQPSNPVQDRRAPHPEANRRDPSPQRSSYDGSRDGQTRRRDDAQRARQRRPSTMSNQHRRHRSEGSGYIWSNDSTGTREDFDEDDDVFSDVSSLESLTSSYLGGGKNTSDDERERRKHGVHHGEDYHWPRGQRGSPSDAGRRPARREHCPSPVRSRSRRSYNRGRPETGPHDRR